MDGVALLVEALQRGGKAVWEPPDRPRLVQVPPDLRGALLGDRETLREILRRAAAFRAHLSRAGVAPILALPDRVPGAAGCVSCGTATPAIRCRLCSVACWIALDRVPPPETVTWP